MTSTEKLNEKKRAHEDTVQQSAELTNCKQKIQQLEEQLAHKNTKQTDDKLTEIFQKALAMNSFPFPNRGEQPHREKPQRSERTLDDPEIKKRTLSTEHTDTATNSVSLKKQKTFTQWRKKQLKKK